MSGKAESSLEPWRRLDGKVVMVTGASSGLGREFAVDLANAGCFVIAAARRTDRLKSLCDEIHRLVDDPNLSMVRRCVAIELDVTQDGACIDSSVQKAWDVFGRIDALVNNAGIRGSVKSPLEISEGEWNKAITTNITGSWLVSKSVCRRMRDAKLRGSIINISSITGLDRGQLPGATAYAISKTGLNTMTKCMALELGMYGITVNSISPGLFRSEMTEKLMQKEWLNTVVLKTYPLRTLGTSDPALTALVRYLIHDMSEYVTGNIFIVDGGATLPGVPIFSSL